MRGSRPAQSQAPPPPPAAAAVVPRALLADHLLPSLPHLPDGVSVWTGRSLDDLRRTASSSSSTLDAERQHALFLTIESLGARSQRAQKIPEPLTTIARMRESDANRLYLLTDNSQGVGILKMGVKRLFLTHPRTKEMVEVEEPLCVLDFYVDDRVQRKGYGKQLFTAMLLAEQASHRLVGGGGAEQLAIDRPSAKFIAFLRRHYGLADAAPQVNNFVVFGKFFDHTTVSERGKLIRQRNAIPDAAAAVLTRAAGGNGTSSSSSYPLAKKGSPGAVDRTGGGVAVVRSSAGNDSDGGGGGGGGGGGDYGAYSNIRGGGNVPFPLAGVTSTTATAITTTAAAAADAFSGAHGGVRASGGYIFERSHGDNARNNINAIRWTTTAAGEGAAEGAGRTDHDAVVGGGGEGEDVEDRDASSGATTYPLTTPPARNCLPRQINNDSLFTNELHGTATARPLMQGGGEDVNPLLAALVAKPVDVYAPQPWGHDGGGRGGGAHQLPFSPSSSQGRYRRTTLHTAVLQPPPPPSILPQLTPFSVDSSFSSSRRGQGSGQQQQQLAQWNLSQGSRYGGGGGDGDLGYHRGKRITYPFDDNEQQQQLIVSDNRGDGGSGRFGYGHRNSTATNASHYTNVDPGAYTVSGDPDGSMYTAAAAWGMDLDPAFCNNYPHSNNPITHPNGPFHITRNGDGDAGDATGGAASYTISPLDGLDTGQFTSSSPGAAAAGGGDWYDPFNDDNAASRLRDELAAAEAAEARAGVAAGGRDVSGGGVSARQRGGGGRPGTDTSVLNWDAAGAADVAPSTRLRSQQPYGQSRVSYNILTGERN